MPEFLRKISLEIYNNRSAKIWFVLCIIQELNHTFIPSSLGGSGNKLFLILRSLLTLFLFVSIIFFDLKFLYEVTKPVTIDISFFAFFRKISTFTILYCALLLSGLLVSYILIVQEASVDGFSFFLKDENLAHKPTVFAFEIVYVAIFSVIVGSRSFEDLFLKTKYIFQNKKVNNVFLLYTLFTLVFVYLSDLREDPFKSIQWIISLAFKIIDVLLLVAIIKQWQQVATETSAE